MENFTNADIGKKVWVESYQKTGTIVQVPPLIPEMLIVSFVGDSELSRMVMRDEVLWETPWAIGDFVQLRKNEKKKGKITRIDEDGGLCRISGFGLDWWAFELLEKVKMIFYPGDECPTCKQKIMWQDAFLEDNLICGC